MKCWAVLNELLKFDIIEGGKKKKKETDVLAISSYCHGWDQTMRAFIKGVEFGFLEISLNSLQRQGFSRD